MREKGKGVLSDGFSSRKGCSSNGCIPSPCERERKNFLINTGGEGIHPSSSSGLREIFTFDHEVKSNSNESNIDYFRNHPRLIQHTYFPEIIQRMTNTCWHHGKELTKGTLPAAAEKKNSYL